MMATLKSRFFYHLMRYALAKGRKRKPSIAEIRASADAGNERLFKMPVAVQTESIKIAGVNGEWIRPDQRDAIGVLLYLHGGAYVSGSIRSHRRLAAKLALASGMQTLIIDYRLAPEHPFPAALEDAQRVYGALLDQLPGVSIAIAGDSAGGGLAVALALRLRDSGLRAPSALALLCPWTDLTLANETYDTRGAVDPFFPDRSALQGAVTAYVGGSNPRNPFISPQHANLAGLPPVLIQVGDLEALLDDSRILAKRLAEDGTSVNLKVYPKMWHVWQAFAGLFREADEAVAELGAFLRTQAAI
jgi:monoterpene epsilon-lactone hydrolase